MQGASRSNLEREGAPWRIGNRSQISSLWERLSLSTFPYRFQLSYALLLECRSFYHRIRLLRKQSDTVELRMGPVWDKDSSGRLTESKRTLVRTSDTQQLLSSRPWLSPEDVSLFLAGWDAGWELREGLDR
jgi:hypothetical protein